MRKLIGWSFVLLALGTTSEGEARGKAARARFEVSLAALEAVLGSAQPAGAIVDRLVETNARIPLFKLEGLCKLYEGLDEEVFGDYRARFKDLEDRLGQVVDAGKHVEFARAIEAPAKTIEWLEARHATLKRSLARFLTAGAWIGSRASVTAAFRSDLEEVAWLKYDEDREYLLERLDDQLKKLVKRSFDMTKLQEGMHELRRQIRWFLLHVQALNGMILLVGEDNPAPGWLADPFATSPYVTSVVPTRREKRPRYVPKSLFVWLTALSERLGDAKDIAEAQEEWLPEALEKSRAVPSRAEAMAIAELLVRRHPGYVDPTTRAAEIYAEVTETKLVPMLREALEGEWPCVESLTD